MTPIEWILGGVLLAMALFLVVAVALQSGKEKGTGIISGNSETFFNKSNATTKDKVLNRLTIGISIAFALIVIIMYVVVSK